MKTLRPRVSSNLPFLEGPLDKISPWGSLVGKCHMWSISGMLNFVKVPYPGACLSFHFRCVTDQDPRLLANGLENPVVRVSATATDNMAVTFSAVFDVYGVNSNDWQICSKHAMVYNLIEANNVVSAKQVVDYFSI